MLTPKTHSGIVYNETFVRDLAAALTDQIRIANGLELLPQATLFSRVQVALTFYADTLQDTSVSQEQTTNKTNTP